MDIQIKLIIEIRSYDDVKVLSKKEIFINSINLGVPLFEFNESDNIFITVEYNSDNFLMKYESINGDMVDLVAFETTNISSGRDGSNYFPGYFSVKIIESKEIHNLLFLVKPKNLGYKNILFLRKYVNEFCNGLSQNLSNVHKGKIEPKGNIMNLNAFEGYLYISDYFPKLINYTNQYLRNRHEESVKIYQLSSSSKRMDGKSARWLSAKGMNKNDNINSPDTLLIRKTKFSIDNVQNRIFKQQLIYWNSELNKIINMFTIYVNDLYARIMELENELSEMNIHYTRVEKENTVSKNIKRKVFSKIDRLKEEKEKLLQTVNTYNCNIEELNHYKRNLELYIYNSWLKNVRTINSNVPNLISSRLQFLIDFKNNYTGFKSKYDLEENKQVSMFTEKSSPKLFETFIFILLINLLRNCGFELDDHFFTRLDNLMFWLSEPGFITLKRNHIYCDIIYDTELRRSSEDFETNGYCTINSQHNRPDFILSFYEKNQKPVYSLVIEAKWRPVINIYNLLEDTDVVINLRDYFQLGYYMIDKRTPDRAIISKVIVVYPDLDEKKLYIQGDEILGIGLYPSEKFNDSQGFLNLKIEITNILSAIGLEENDEYEF